MTPYELGQRNAANTFKVADYASWIAEKLTPKNELPFSKVVRNATVGAGLGASIGETLGQVGTTANVLKRVADLTRSGKYPPGHVSAAVQHPQFNELMTKALERGGERGRGLGGLLGLGAGSFGSVGLNKLNLMRRQRAMAQGIRHYAPRVGLGVGATALAAGILNHVLSRND